MIQIKELEHWMKIEEGIDHEEYYIPTTTPICRIRFYPKDNLLVFEEKDKYFDDHAYVSFSVTTANEIKTIVNCLHRMKTI